MEKAKKLIIENLHWVVIGGTALLIALFLIIGHPNEEGFVTLTGGQVTIEESTEQFIEQAQDAIIEYSKNAIPAVIENADGTTSEIEVPTVDSIDGGEILHDEECNEEECGLGSYIYAPTDTYQHFKDYTIGKCWNVDGYAGAQCWDLSSLHSMNYTNDKRVFSTCGTGAAKGMWNCKEKNAGSEYSLVYDVYKTKTGDIGVWGTGVYGHTCVIAGPVKNGYVACLGQNQGGSACPGGGAATNIINLSINGFLGAFHPKTYVDPTPPEPTPTPTPTPVNPRSGDVVEYSYVKGDYFSKVLVNLGLSEGNLWGSDGTVNYYTNQLIQQNMLDGRGNVKIGIPFKLTVR